LSGKDYYLGIWPVGRRTPPADVQEKYERLIAEYLASGRQRLPDHRRGDAVNVSAQSPEDKSLSIAEILAMYWDHAETYYRRPDGSPSPELHCLRAAFRPLRRLYDDLPAADFSPKKLKAVREMMMQAGLTRTTINRQIGRIKRVFKWAVENELIPSGVFHGLQAVTGLKAGRSDAKEPRAVRPVAREIVEKTIPHLPSIVAAMVKLQMLTGMRSGEVCRVRPCDLERASDLWRYRPAEHKTARHGRDRIVLIGPQSQEILGPLVDQARPEDYVFSPVRSEAIRREQLSKRRKTPLWPLHLTRNRRKRKARPIRAPKERYDSTSYARAIARACHSAFPLPDILARRITTENSGGERLERISEWQQRLGSDGLAAVARRRKANHWHPHQLRHLKAAEVRERFGLDAAQATLGHSEANTTEIYAEVSVNKAAEVARLTG
jgi:integrase